MGYRFSTAHRLLLVLGVIAAFLVPTGGSVATAAEKCPAGWVSLTFDDGPTRGRSEAVYEVLERTGTAATFFSIGRRVARNPDMALALVRAGHVVANHSWAHVDLTLLPTEEVLSSVRRTDTALRAIGVEPLRLVRPPFLRTNETIDDALHEAGFSLILETVNSKDWMDITPEAITSRVVSGASDGAVIGLHDGTIRYGETAIAVDMIIETLTDSGFCFGVLDGDGNVVPPEPVVDRSPSPSSVEVDEMIWIKYLLGP